MVLGTFFKKASVKCQFFKAKQLVLSEVCHFRLLKHAFVHSSVLRIPFLRKLIKKCAPEFILVKLLINHLLENVFHCERLKDV